MMPWESEDELAFKKLAPVTVATNATALAFDIGPLEDCENVL